MQPEHADRVMDQLTADPGFLLSRVGTAIQIGFKQLLSGYGLRPLEFLILELLDGSDGVSQQDLCRAAGVDSGNMVEFLDTLEAVKFAKRTRDPTDRRRYIVTITATGVKSLKRIEADIAAYNDDFLSALSDAERRRLVGLLIKLFETTEESRSRGGPLHRHRGAN